jgi:hypothetical protein
MCVADALHFLVEFLECTTLPVNSTRSSSIMHVCTIIAPTVFVPLDVFHSLPVPLAHSRILLARIRCFHFVGCFDENVGEHDYRPANRALFLAMPFCFQNLYHHQSCCNLWLAPRWGGSNLGRATQKFKPISVLSTSSSTIELVGHVMYPMLSSHCTIPS